MSPHADESTPAAVQPLRCLCESLLERGIEQSVGTNAGLNRLEASVESLPQLPALAASSGLPFFFFQERAGGESFFGVEEAAWFAGPAPEAANRAAQLLRQSARGIHAYGGGRFDPASARKSSHWAPFSDGLFFIPRLELRTVHGVATAALHYRPDEDAYELLQKLAAPADAENTDQPREVSVERTEDPGYAEWENLVRAALQAIEAGELEKVVAAREVCASLAGDQPPGWLLPLLWQQHAGCFHFAFRPSRGARVFCGASPELLFERTGRKLRTEAVAGTCARGRNEAEGERLARAMLENDKEQREHRSVSSAIHSALSPLAEAIHAPESPSVLKLTHLQHLRTPLTADLLGGVSDADLLRALHPTPATNGSPRENAMLWLRENETWDRGWYAGPLGVLSTERSLFTVAIRSALLGSHQARVFAGAGIVRGSDAGREWVEVGAKAAEFLRLLSE